MGVNDLIAEIKSSLSSAPKNEAGKVRTQSARVDSAPPLCYIVDDEPEIGKLIAASLKGAGIQTKTFESAKLLMEGLTQRHPQLIFLDISLARSDAVEVLRELAKVGYKGQINLMSGHRRQLLTDIKAIGEANHLQMLPPLIKPFAIETIRKIAVANVPVVSKEAPHIAIEDALSRGWMKVWYQPKIDLKAKMLVGCEALARIDHPEHGIISPGSFLPGATTESLSRLAEHVLLTVFHDCVSFKNAGLSLKPAVNIPVDVLLTLPLAQLVRDNRPKGDAWKGLTIEVTEDQIVRDVTRAQEIATQLKIYDISLSIDDFGAGYSSLARLKHFPFSELKLDMSFVKDCASNPQNAALCKTVIDLAHSFKALAVAEGIEKPDDLRALVEMGCDVGQGYLLAKPMPIEAFLSMLQKRSVTPQSSMSRLNKIA
jgi:EAL domain-containing protein (putative c-di-GMP-specific phosphodiesterase class I)/CheY-like chemotaxis protein